MTTMMTMVYRSRNAGLRPINSKKHIVDLQGGLTIDTQTVGTIAKGVDNAVLANVNEVEAASRINSLFLNVQVAASSTAALANVYLAIVKNPGNDITFPNANTLGTSDTKRFVIHQEMIMTEKNTTALPRTLFKGVIRIPRGYRQMRINDELEILLYSPGVTYDFCWQAIFKEYR